MKKYIGTKIIEAEPAYRVVDAGGKRPRRHGGGGGEALRHRGPRLQGPISGRL